jgi:transcriptional regulator with XRE-family HTH domain
MLEHLPMSLKELGEHIRCVRESQGFSIATLARLSNVDRSNINNIERGQDHKYSTLCKILTALGCRDVSELKALCREC